MFTVTGTINGEAYRLGVHSEPQEAGGTPLMGSAVARAFVQAREGTQVQATPTSDPVTVSLDDPASVLACLYAGTRVGSVEGQAPDVFESADVRPGIIH